MLKFFTRTIATLALVATLASAAMAQTAIWPTADTNTIKVSQFNGAATLLRVTDSTPNAMAWTSVPATYKGWITHGMQSSNPAKRDSAVWTWSAAASGVGGAYYGTIGAINSPSRTNGAVVFNSDGLDNRGIAGNFENGASPATAGVNHISELVSPIINASGYSSIFLQFNQLVRRLNINPCLVAYSQDSGRTWSTPVNVNTDLAGNVTTDNATTAGTTKVVKLRGAVGTTGFRIKFIFSGYYYFWIIDDVKLFNAKFDLAISNFNALPSSYKTPYTQVDTIRFLADARNNGNPMPNAKLGATVWRITRDAAGTETARTRVYNGTFNYGTFPSDSLIENKLITTTYLPPATPAEYLGSYKVFGDSADVVTANDSFNYSFFVTDQVANIDTAAGGAFKTNFSKEAWETTAAITTTFSTAFWPNATDPRSIRLGNFYRINNRNNTVVRLSARMSLTNVAGNTVRAALYRWRDANGDDIAQPSERTLVSATDTLIPTAATGNAWLNFEMKTLADQPIITADTTNYLAMIEVNNTINVTSPPNFVFVRQSYGAMQAATKAAGSPRYYMTYGVTSTSDWNFGSFNGNDVVPAVRLFVYPFRVNTADILSDNNKLEVFPNPSNGDFVTVKVELEKAQQAGIRITSIDGRVISDQETGLIQKDFIRVNTNELTNGVYLIQLLTQDGVKTKKLVIAR